MSDRYVDVVPVWQDLLSEGAVIFAVGVLETIGDVLKLCLCQDWFINQTK